MNTESGVERHTQQCPWSGDDSQRKSSRGPAVANRGVIERGDVWHVSEYWAARKLLRASDATKQAGFNSEMVAGLRMKKPVLFQDGAPHREQRAAIARFFTPKTVDAQYRQLMETLADSFVDRFQREGGGDLSRISLELAVQVAARVVGLTDSRKPGMAQRLEALLSFDRLERTTRLQRILESVRSQLRMRRFYVDDVKPAIASRRSEPREDVISHLLEKGYKPLEILIECVTYGAAGMATTREFIVMAAWHLLENDGLRRQFLTASEDEDEDERHRILHEILRLEPVVGGLYRRTLRDVEVESGTGTTVIPAGSRVLIDVRAANADDRAVGEKPLELCPHRELSAGVQPQALSFGDGVHRCPGAFIAIQETDIFLTRLLALPVVMERPPELTWNDLIEGYELRGMQLRLPAAKGERPELTHLRAS